MASIAAVVYLDILTVPAGSAAFLQSAYASGGFENRGIFSYEPGIHFVSTLFVPGRWQKYRLEVQPRFQEIHIKLPLRYSAYLRLGDLFYIQLKLRVEGEIPHGEAFSALKALQMKPTDRDRFIEEQIRLLVAEYYVDLGADEKKLEKVKTQFISFFNANNVNELQKRLDIQLRGSWFKLRSIELKEIYVPDSELYAAQTRNLPQVSDAERAALLHQIAKESELALERKRNLEDAAKAERMGALIAENPDILEYYKIEKLAPRTGTVILDATGKAKRNLTIHNDLNSARGRNGKGENSDGGEIGSAE